MKTVEYKVRPVTRFIVTRFEAEGNGASSTQIGEYMTQGGAELVATALAGHEQSQGVNASLRRHTTFDEVVESARE